jgi:hypothetical protein
VALTARVVSRARHTYSPLVSDPESAQAADQAAQVGSHASLPETAYYYPEPYWLLEEGDWIKGLLLFFDDVAILLPDYMRGRERAADPVLAGALADQGLLRIIEPEWFIDRQMAEEVTHGIVELVEAGTFRRPSERSGFGELSMSRMGAMVDQSLFESVLSQLRDSGLALETRDGVSIPLERGVRTAFLLLLAQYARHTGRRHGLNLHPASNAPRVDEGLRALLEADVMPSRGNVVGFDLETVGVDLEAVPLDELIDYRREHHAEHHEYMRNLRGFVGELSEILDQEQREALYEERAEALRDEAERIKRRLRDAWKRPKTVSSFALGLVGAGWSTASADPWPVVMGNLGGGLLSLLPDRKQGSAYSYLFSVRRDLR